MSYNIFFISDTHFGHESPYTKFKREDGSPLRPFSCAAEGDEHIINNWNRVVKPGDRIYHVGDVAMSKRHIPLLERCNGRKVLIKGNHDVEPINTYLKYFDDIRAVHQFDGLLISHIPVHPDSLARWGFNVHGHLHANRVMVQSQYSKTTKVIDPRYFNVSVECINYTPISLEEVKKHKSALADAS